MDIINSILPAIEHFRAIGYWIALFAALLETIIGIGLIIPGSTIILFLGALAAKGYLDLGDLIWFSVLGAIIGDNVNYYLGRRYGLKMSQTGLWFIKPKHFQKGARFFEKHGGKSVFIGRFLPNIKEVMPLIAGTCNMKQVPFMIWNVLGAIGWSLAWILPGYFFAQSLDLTQKWIERIGVFLTLFVILTIILYFIRSREVKKELSKTQP